MYYVYAVILGNNNEKSRYLAGSSENEFLAKHMANVETCGAASYAYVKDSKGGTIFFIRRPGYDPIPEGPPRPPAQPVTLDQHRRRYRPH